MFGTKRSRRSPAGGAHTTADRLLPEFGEADFDERALEDAIARARREEFAAALADLTPLDALDDVA